MGLFPAKMQTPGHYLWAMLMNNRVSGILLPVIAAILVFTGFTTNLLAQENNDPQLAALFKNANKLGTFNGNVLVADKGRILYLGSIGRADTAAGSKLTLAH